MMDYQLAPYAEKHPTAPDGWEPLASLPIKEHRAPIEYLLNDGNTKMTRGVTNLDFVIYPEKPVAWRRREP
jgi:hypothetical protein